MHVTLRTIEAAILEAGQPRTGVVARETGYACQAHTVVASRTARELTSSAVRGGRGACGLCPGEMWQICP